ncbi:MAG: DUF1648 domain-containing protein [Microbacteriaceae bacterium]|nr:DUF1648 domain-containing protein [Microbacteriaceae bacterium]
MTNLDSLDLRIRSTHRRTILVGGVLPIAIATIATVLMVSWLPQLPDPIAVHWSGAGPDGFGPAWPFTVATILIVLAYCAFAIGMSWQTTPTGSLSYNQKLVLTTGVWLSALLSIVFGASIAVQRGLADARDAPDIGIFLVIGAAAGLLLAAGTWFILPPGESIDEAGESPTPLDLRGDERLSWSHSARLGSIAITIVGVSLAVATSVAVFATVVSSSSMVFAVALLVFVSALAVTTTWWRVSADHRGLTVRGAIGWPVKRIPLDDIRTVQVVDVHPTRDFGGYGWRWTVDGRSGVILRAGTGIEVTASSGKRFVVTVDDAETGAGVIAALLSRQLPRRR